MTSEWTATAVASKIVIIIIIGSGRTFAHPSSPQRVTAEDEILKYYILNMHTLTLMCSTHGCDDRYAFYKLCEKGMINFSE